MKLNFINTHRVLSDQIPINITDVSLTSVLAPKNQNIVSYLQDETNFETRSRKYD